MSKQKPEIMFTNEMEDLIKASHAFVESISAIELRDMSSKYDNYEVKHSTEWFHTRNFTDYLCNYSRYKLFDYFDQEKKAVTLKKDLLKKNPNKVLSLF